MTNVFQGHCESVYRALEERAVLKHLDDGTVERVFTGGVSEIYNSLNISQTYYGPIFRTLEDVGSILRIQRGARGIDSVMVLRGLPTEWPEGLGWRGRNSHPLTDDSRYGKVLLDVQELQESIGGINVIMALAELEQRITVLERQDRRSNAKDPQ